MGDSSLISGDYQRASWLADFVGRGVLEVKRASLRIPSNETPDAVAELQEVLGSILRALLVALTDREPDTAVDRESSLKARNLLSSELVETIRRARGGDLPYFIEDLRQATSALSGLQSGTLGTKEINVLDEIASAADAEASRVYRRMRRS